MLETPLSPNSKKTKRRKLLSLNRPHNITPQSFDDTPIPFPKPSTPTTTLPPTSQEDWVESPKSSRLESTENTTTILGEYHCPICNMDLTPFNTSYSRQQHIDTCLSSSTMPTIDDENRHFGHVNDDQALESLFMDYCSFCGKSISHLKGIHKERHFDQCLTALETEQQQQRLTTYAGHSIPFLQDLDICPVCHDILPGLGLRNKISHIKRCSKQRSLTMDQLLRKIQWMQWGHLPIQNTSSATADTSSSITPLPISYTSFATEPPPTITNITSVSTRSTPSLTIKKPTTTNDTNSQVDDDDDDNDDFSKNVLVYRMASGRQTRFNKQKVEPTEDESIAMALSLSLMSEEEQRSLSSKRGISKRKKQKMNLDMANIVSIEESRVLAKLALEKMLSRYPHDPSSVIRFPLVTSHVQPTILPRQQQQQHSHSQLSSTTTTSLWSLASCLEND